MPARYLFPDEVDAYLPSADEGDPAVPPKRAPTFVAVQGSAGSTPTIQDFRIEREYSVR
jgi:hypothetical protein